MLWIIQPLRGCGFGRSASGGPLPSADDVSLVLGGPLPSRISHFTRTLRLVVPTLQITTDSEVEREAVPLTAF